jgi:hypothetical protein
LEQGRRWIGVLLGAAAGCGGELVVPGEGGGGAGGATSATSATSSTSSSSAGGGATSSTTSAGEGGSGGAGGAEPSCDDGQRNGDEADVDCGGSCPSKCALGAECGVAGDCVTDHCEQGVCATKGDGQACTGTAQCASGHCVDGVCCDEACGDICEACTAALKGAGADGQCAPIVLGADPQDECADEGAASCGLTGACDGQGACELYAAGTECRAAVDSCDVAETCPGAGQGCPSDLFAPTGTVCAMPSCAGGLATLASTCDGGGTCAAGGTVSCAPYTCDASATSCLSSCTSDANCDAATPFCTSAGSCVAAGAVPGAIPGLRIWLKADVLSQAQVCTWPDSSGHGFDATQVTSTACPTLSATSIGGMPAVSFDGVDDVLGNASATVGAEHTMCAVWRVNAEENEGWVFALEPSDGRFSGFSHRRGGAPNKLAIETASSNAGSSVTFVTSSMPPDPTPYIVCGLVSGASGTQTSDLYVNGSLDENPPMQDAASTVDRLGYSVGRMTVWGGVNADIAEVLVYQGVLSQGQREDVESYLAQKYGL